MKPAIPEISLGARDVPRLTAVPSVIGDVWAALRDGWPLLKRNAAGAVLFAIIGITLETLTTQTPLRSSINLASLLGQTILAFAITYFGASAATRTIHPASRMSVGGFVRFVALSVAVVLLTVAGLAALIVPGFLLLGKLWPAPYALLLGSERPFKDCWRATTGAYWKTLGTLWLVFVLDFAVVLLSIAITRLCANYPILISPAFGAYWVVLMWSLFVGSLVYVRWTYALLSRAEIQMTEESAW